MTIRLPDELADYIHATVKSGRFASSDDAIAEAVRRFRQWEQEGSKHGEPAESGRRISLPLVSSRSGKKSRRSSLACRMESFSSYRLMVLLSTTITFTGRRNGRPCHETGVRRCRVLDRLPPIAKINGRRKSVSVLFLDTDSPER